MSAFDRHPRRAAYEAMAKRMAYFDALHRLVTFSPQNRRVRFNADVAIARAKDFPNTVTRQQRRFAARRAA